MVQLYRINTRKQNGGNRLFLYFLHKSLRLSEIILIFATKVTN